MNEKQRELLQKATMYDLLAENYKYVDPNLHIKYYKKHLKYISLMRFSRDNIHHPYVHIRFINLLSREITIQLNGLKAISHIASQAVSDYFVAPTNIYDLEIFSSKQNNESLHKQKLEVKGGHYTTYIITGSLDGIKVLTFQTEQYLPESETKLRVIQLVTDSDPLDIHVQNGDIVFSNVAYGQATNYLGLTPMSVNLELSFQSRNSSKLPLEKFHLFANEIYSLLLVREDHSGYLKALLVKD